jgi:MarR family transcriptional regulator, lower aerobic nicotinate degradation pathway regulator
MQAVPRPTDAANDAARASLESALNAQGIDSRQYRIAWLIREFGPQSQVSLCDMMQVDRASMVKFVDRLETRGWVTREPHPSDRRQNAVTLTAKGRKALKSADAAALACEQQTLAVLTSEQRVAFLELLKALVHRGPTTSG